MLEEQRRAAPQEQYQPLVLVATTLLALLGCALFFFAFLIAPLAILAIFYVVFSVMNRTGVDPEARQRQATIEAQDLEQGRADERRRGSGS